MATAPEPVDLPEESEYQEVFDKLQAAHDTLESLAFRLMPLDDVPTPERDVPGTSRPVTVADLGGLYSFLESTGMQLWHIKQNRKRLRRALQRLDHLHYEPRGGM